MNCQLMKRFIAFACLGLVAAVFAADPKVSQGNAAQLTPGEPPPNLPPGHLIKMDKPLTSPVPTNAKPNPLIWDSMAKSVTTKPLQSTNQFVFWVTNTAKTNVTID